MTETSLWAILKRELADEFLGLARRQQEIVDDWEAPGPASDEKVKAFDTAWNRMVVIGDVMNRMGRIEERNEHLC